MVFVGGKPVTALTWMLGIGLPTLVGFACFAGAVASWFRIPVIGHYLGLALAMLGVGFVAHASGYSAARQHCQEAAVRAELAQARADLAIAKAVAEQARELGDRLNVSEARNLELAHEIASRPVDDVCRLGADDIKRLLNIR